MILMNYVAAPWNCANKEIINYVQKTSDDCETEQTFAVFPDSFANVATESLCLAGMLYVATLVAETSGPSKHTCSTLRLATAWSSIVGGAKEGSILRRH
jgi:hypothetical protein